jgi:hypothetical protein
LKQSGFAILLIPFLLAAGLAAQTLRNTGSSDTMNGPPADATPVPPEAIYLGTDMGGDFVTLSRVDLTYPQGRVVPAYRMQIIGAWANAKNYGAERVGGEVFKGIGIYVPPEFSRGRPEAYTPPDPAIVLRDASEQEKTHNTRRFRAWVDNGMLWISLPHEPGADKMFWLASVIPAIRD